jgi:hypothetical protein
LIANRLAGERQAHEHTGIRLPIGDDLFEVTPGACAIAGLQSGGACLCQSAHSFRRRLHAGALTH